MTSDGAVATVDSMRPLSQVERVVDTFVAPAKTFADILRSASWWLPCVLMAIFSLATAVAVDKQVGYDRSYENQLHNSPRQEERLAALTPEQRAQQMKVGAAFSRGISYAIPLVLLAGFAFYALILWGCFNFILGAETRYGQVFAVCFYAALPYLLLNVLTIIILYVGGNAEAYDYKNPVGTNLAYYLPDAAPWAKALLGRLDVIQLWTLALTVLGMKIVSKKTLAGSAAIVVGWWWVVTLLGVGVAAFS